MLVTATEREKEIAENAAMAALIAGRLDEDKLLEITDDFEGIVRTIVRISTSFLKDKRKNEMEQLRDFVTYAGDELLHRYGAPV